MERGSRRPPASPFRMGIHGKARSGKGQVVESHLSSAAENPKARFGGRMGHPRSLRGIKRPGKGGAPGDCEPPRIRDRRQLVGTGERIRERNRARGKPADRRQLLDRKGGGPRRDRQSQTSGQGKNCPRSKNPPEPEYMYASPAPRSRPWRAAKRERRVFSAVVQSYFRCCTLELQK
jgi:hypothetical protein